MERRLGETKFMRSLKTLTCLAALALAPAFLPGCESKVYDYPMTEGDLTPEMIERHRQLEQEAQRAIAAGEPIPPDLITIEMLNSGMLNDGVLMTPEQQQQMQQRR